MATTMKAFRWAGRGTPLTLHRTTPIPTPPAGYVLIQVRAAGLCHSDCDFLSGANADAIPTLPITLGHEVAGLVVGCGAGVSEKEWHGARVAVWLGGHPARLAGEVMGLEMDGGYAEYAVAPTKVLMRVPDAVGFPEAAVAVDALTTAYHAVHSDKAGEVQAGQRVAVVGLGGLGATAARLAVLAGARVWGFDINADKCAAVVAAGGVEGCYASVEEVGADVLFDVVLDFVGRNVTVNAALKKIAFYGRIVLVGISNELTMRGMDLIWNNVQLRACLGGSMEELGEVMVLLEAGKLRPDLEEIAFESVVEGLARLDRGEVKGRLFCRPNGGE